MKKEKPKNKGGRQWFDGKDEETVLSLLRQAWSMGCPDTEAILLADISNSALQRYYDIHPELRDIRSRLQEKPFLDARTTIARAVKESPQYAFEYMKRKKRGEFGDSVDLTTDGKALVLPSEIINRNAINAEPGNNSK